ncbi:serine protease inhibitor dipetalogastin-like [Colias croceus]|uniref:serine protease inhibitor dipetalogastin-like n=1 Tax=Colias crocea TaxID=72248 RepID=UPI001E27EA4B|nr:serine protease inhibitor dipetalogastin-like [Colias croceus]
MVYRLGALVLVSGYISVTLALPPCVCNRNLQPVCGSDGQTYNNECLLDCAATKKPDLRFARPGNCDGSRLKRENKETYCACPDNLDPVCGSDGITYPNECLLKCNPSLEVEHQGRCREKRANEFLCACPANLDYVCGSDGKTYPNECALRCTPNVAVQYKGQCRVKREEIQVASLNLPKCECSSESNPVCGTDSLTYQNPCLLNCGKAYNANLELKHDGPCEIVRAKPVGNVPNCTCTRNLSPVCASNGVTYGNSCIMKCVSEDLTMVRDGPCEIAY